MCGTVTELFERECGAVVRHRTRRSRDLLVNHLSRERVHEGEGAAGLDDRHEASVLGAPYAPGGGRHPRFPHPLVCPSLLPPLEPNDEVAGLPAYRPDGDEPWMFDARLVLRLR